MASTRRTAQLLPAILCVASQARAEGERAVSVVLGWATFSAPGEAMANMEPTVVSPDGGGALAVSYEHALSADFSLRAELAGGLFYGGNSDEQTAMSYAGLVDVGAVVRFDVLKYVPYAFGGVGVLATAGGPIDRSPQPLLAVGGGLDILVSRSRSWGIEGRLASFIGDITIFTLGFRGTLRWGYF